MEFSASLPYHLIMQAKLISSIRSTKSSDDIAAYANVAYWRSLSSDFTRDTKSEYTSAYLNQLVCRSLIQIQKCSSWVPGVEANNIISPQRVIDDTVNCCQEFIDAVWDQSEHGFFVGSFVDAYDIFAVGVVFICFSSGATYQPEQTRRELSEMINKVSALLTVIAERFPALKVFRKLIWALSSQASESRQSHYTVSSFQKVKFPAYHR